MELINPTIKNLSFEQRKEVKNNLKNIIQYTLSMADGEETIDDVFNQIVGKIWDMKI